MSVAGFAARSPLSAAGSTCAARIAAIGATAGSAPAAAAAAAAPGAAPAALASRAAARSFRSGERRSSASCTPFTPGTISGSTCLEPRAFFERFGFAASIGAAAITSSSAFFAAACSAARRLAPEPDTFTSSFGTVHSTSNC
ncbi:hypothetical protein IST4112_01463 [Burkholderia cenocepacia]|nr:hypothetical protein IST4112_01463 [Burkholderia cenocepacia]